MLKKGCILSLLVVLVIGFIYYRSFSKETFSTNLPILASITPTKYIEKNDDLLGRIEIPKIKVAESIYSLESPKNTVDQHVSILKGSILPNNNQPSIVFLAAHSGSGSVAYFKDLDQLKIGDLIFFYYQKIQYTYQVIKVFEQEKDGDIELVKSSNQQLVLTTCSPIHKDQQLIVDTMLIEKKEK